jgi:hypothetical protein
MLRRSKRSRRGGWRGRMVRRSLRGAALASVLLVGVGGGVAASAVTTQRAGTGVAGCFDPASYPVPPAGRQDDSPRIQAAIDDAVAAGGGTVCLGSRHWAVSRAPAGSYDRFAALSTHGAHVTITGTGPGTVIDLSGDQQHAAVSVFALDPGAKDITIERLTIDTSGATNTDEQTHAIGIGSGVCTILSGTCSMPVTDVIVREVNFVHPHAGTQRKGDCIRILGNTPATKVERVTIIGSSFTNCARSGIGVQRNVISLAVLGNHFGGNIGDTAFDAEASGGGSDDGLRLTGNSFAGSTVNFSASLTNYGHAIVTGNTFAGRGLSLYRSRDILVAGNTFDVTEASGVGVIDAENVADGLKIDGNVIRRHGMAGPAIKVTPHSGGIPNRVSISNNTIVVDGNSDGIYGDSVRNFGVRDNDITFTGPAPAGSGIHLDAISGPIDQAMITGNTIAGPLTATGGNTYYAAVRLAARPATISGVTVALNSARGALRSLDCSQTGGSFPQPIISLGNRWTVAPTCPVATLEAGQ